MIVELPRGSISSFTNLSVSCYASVELVYPSAPAVFRHRHGLPIKISVKLIAMLEAKCIHDIENNLSVAIKPNKVEWIIEGENKSSGAFKVGHSDNAEYHSRDYGESVIYHPPLELTTAPKKIEMRVKVTHPAGDSENRINIDLQLQRGFGKGLSSSANVALKSTNEIVNMQNIEKKACKICSPKLIFHKPDNQIVLAGMVQKEDKCLMTYEYVKMMSHGDKIGGQIWLTSRVGEQVPLGIEFSPDQQLRWRCSAGKFVGSNTGRSVIYLTPDESELSKSPVTITLHEGEEEENGRTIASRSFWLLRGSSVMHC